MKVPIVECLLAASLASGCGAAQRSSTTDAAPVTVSVARADITNAISTFEAGGVVRARKTAFVASRLMAPVAEVRVRAGDRVRRGTTLITLDTREVQANSQQATAAASAAAESARAAEADVRSAESGLVLATATHDRISALYAKRSATASELDQAIASLTEAQAHRTSAQARLAAANASRDAAQASSRAAAATASYAALSAPFDGVVSERLVDPGSMAMPGAPLLTLEDPTSHRVEVQLDEARAALASIGQTAAVQLGDTSDAWIDGRIVEIARVDSASHAFMVKIDVPASESLRSGTFGRARLYGPARPALTVPTTALVSRGQLTFVYLVDPEGFARLRPVSIGAADHDRTEVLAGLQKGIPVITNPPPMLTDGARVKGNLP